MKKLFILFLISGLFSCSKKMEEIDIPSKISFSNNKLQVVFTDVIPAGLKRISFFEKGDIKKEITDLYQFNPGDTVLIEWDFKDKTEYSLMGFASPGEMKYFTFKNSTFWVDTAADSLVLDYPINTAAKKVSY